MMNLKKNVFLFGKNGIYLSKRTLFSRTSLQLDGFQKLRLNFDVNRSDYDFYNVIKHSSIPTLLRVTKFWTLRATKKDEDFELLRYSLNRIYESCSTITSKEETTDLHKIAPMTMRLFHYFDSPEKALQFYYEFNNTFFDSKTTSYILLDLLFESGKYNEILEVYRIRTHERQIIATPLHRVMVYAACYKLNTLEALEYALKSWSENERQFDQSRRFLAMLALNKKKPEAVVGVLPENSDYSVDMNIKLLLMTELRDWNGICDLLYKIKSSSKEKRYRVSTEVATKIRDTLEESKENLSPQEWDRCDRFLSELRHYNLLYTVTLDKMLCRPIEIKRKEPTQGVVQWEY